MSDYRLDLEPGVGWAPSGFGRFLVWPTTARSVVLATRGMQLHPIRLLLPHQVYEKDVMERYLQGEERELWALPVVGDWKLLATKVRE